MTARWCIVVAATDDASYGANLYIVVIAAAKAFSRKAIIPPPGFPEPMWENLTRESKIASKARVESSKWDKTLGGTLGIAYNLVMEKKCIHLEECQGIGIPWHPS